MDPDWGDYEQCCRIPDQRRPQHYQHRGKAKVDKSSVVEKGHLIDGHTVRH